MESKSSSLKTFMVKVFKSKSYDKMFILKLVNDDKFLPRTFSSYLPGVKSGDLITFEGRLFKNEKGYEAIFILPKTVKVV